MNHRDGEERIEAYGETFPAHDQATVLALEPRKCPLGLEARDALFDGAPTRLSGLPHPFGIWGLIPRRRSRWRRSLASYPLSVAMTLSRSRGLPRLPVRMWKVSNSGMTWARSSPLAGVVHVNR